MDLDELRRRAAAAAQTDDEDDNPVGPNDARIDINRPLPAFVLSGSQSFEDTDYIHKVHRAYTETYSNAFVVPPGVSIVFLPHELPGRRFPAVTPEPSGIPCFIEFDGHIERCGYYGEMMALPDGRSNRRSLDWADDQAKFHMFERHRQFRLYRHFVYGPGVVYENVAIYCEHNPTSLTVDGCARGYHG